jgi:murein L,D-transpeptidase YcbB/YkuD
MGPGGEFEIEGSDPDLLKPKGPSKPLTQEQMGPGGEFEIEGSDQALLKSKAEPPWVAGARRYNNAHASYVGDFNEATNNSCMIDGQLDAQAVARWQARHGLAPDGKVGPLTLAAARKVRVSSADADLDARPPV